MTAQALDWFERLADACTRLCDWTADVANIQATTSHAAWHYGSPCPYYVVGELLAGRPDPRDTVAEWRIDISAALDAKGKVPLSLNSRMHWAAHASAVARIKNVTRNAVLAADVPHLDHVHVEMHYQPRSNRFRDIDNLVATLKPAIDALHQRDTAANVPVPFSPIIDGDDPRFLSWSPPVLHPWSSGHHGLWLILRSYS